ncbi:MAG: antitoxin Xre/MbcA/ParS toxin-binding domain-containing protein [Vulcanimicrobiaceae bacterium]
MAAPIDQWIDAGVPPDRIADIGRVASVARRLRNTVKRERIPAIVRQPNPGLGGKSVLEVLARKGGVGRVMDALDRLASFVPAR